jgi:sulfur carrier protein
MLNIVLNGEPRSVPRGHDLQALIESLALTGQALALAVNREVVPRQRWAGYLLQAEDRIDIVRAIGGG